MSLDFIKLCIFPILLTARANLTIFTCNCKMGILDSHLIDIMLIELEYKWLIDVKEINSLRDGYMISCF